jgi:hypothetical protein
LPDLPDCRSRQSDEWRRVEVSAVDPVSLDQTVSVSPAT